MDNHLPFGYTHRQKRSHDMMESNAGPAWSFENLTPFTSLGVPREPRAQGPSHDANRRGSASHRNPMYTAAGQRARTPDAAATAVRTRYLASQEPSAPPNDRSTSAGPAHHSGQRYREEPAQNTGHGQVSRFEGDGFDMRRPVGWRARAGGSSSADDRHLVEISDSEEEDPTVLDEGEDDMFSAEDHIPQADGHDSEDVVDLTEDDNTPAHQWWRIARPTQNHEQQRPPPPHADRPPVDASRLPRGMAGIINLDNGEEAWTVDDEPVILEPSSPDIQFVSARRLEPHNRPVPPPQRNDSDGDDVQFVQERPLSQQERQARQRAMQHAELDRVFAVLGEHRHDQRSFAHLRGQIDRANAHIQQLADNMRQGGPQPPPRVRRGNQIRMGVAFVRPNLNFGMVGFDLGYERDRPEPPPPTYEAPPSAPEGFTRSPEETDVLVCPNCDSELCKGDDDIKKQVWIAKSCGHIYCGECTANRSNKASAKGKEKQATPKTKPFNKCVVEGCDKKVSGSKAMFQIFML